MTSPLEADVLLLLSRFKGWCVAAMNDTLRIRLGAVTLALLTLAAVVFAALNFQQRVRFVPPDDGVAWTDTARVSKPSM